MGIKIINKISILVGVLGIIFTLYGIILFVINIDMYPYEDIGITKILTGLFFIFIGYAFTKLNDKIEHLETYFTNRIAGLEKHIDTLKENSKK